VTMRIKLVKTAVKSATENLTALNSETSLPTLSVAFVAMQVTWPVTARIDNVVLTGATMVQGVLLVQQLVVLMLEMLSTGSTSNLCKNSLEAALPVEMPHSALSLVPRVPLTKDHLMLMSNLGNVAQLARLPHGKSVLVIKEVTMDATPLLPEALHLGLETVAEEATIVVAMPTTVANQQLLALHLHGNNQRPLHSLELLLLVMLDILHLVILVDILLSKPWVLHLDLQLPLD